MNKDNFSDFIRVLKEKNDIVEVIGSYIKLERRGYNQGLSNLIENVCLYSHFILNSRPVCKEAS